MNTIDIHGKPYVMVKDRVDEFHKKYPNGSIRTELIEMTERFIVKATVIPDIDNPERCFTGHAEETIGSSQINKTSALEVSETSAIGRACGALNIGIIDSFASADEVSTAVFQQNEQEATGVTHQDTPKTAENGLKCPKCQSGVWDNRVADKDGNLVINEKKHPSFKCKNTDCSFVTWETDSLEAGVMPMEQAPRKRQADLEPDQEPALPF